MPLITADDRAMARLALPALGALAAEPLYLLADTAIIGHLGTPQLAALGIAGAILTTSFTLFNFLAYGTTAQVARLHGAGEEEAAGRIAAQALWLASGLGLALLAAIVALAGPLVALFGAGGETSGHAVSYLRISAIGLPFALIALAGQGWLRGVADLRTPLVIVIAGNAANVALDLLFVYGFDWGMRGSAAGTAIAQAGMGGAFALLLLRAPVGRGGGRRPDPRAIRSLARVGGHLFVRTAALTGSFAVAGAVLARVGSASLGAHQIAFQLWSFLALVLDAVAIAAQVIVGRALGAGRALAARAAARRMIWWSVAFGALLGAVMLALGGIVPHAFTDDPAVVERTREVWWLFALMQPAAGAVFALDGILIGAGDSRFLMWSMLACAVGVFVPLALLSLALGWGIVGVWCGIVALIASRLLLTLVRFARGGWMGAAGARG
ncbi:MATE family efflux transporter [Conexibacter arvalis]|uniref:Putative MATE family efflux protein n=1 Tax=Conexibacter arvalis TaxID=912552 RepID=A0A840IHA7_9ACTN|nr:MATE family efflux transporter [Conexibacter arvalis]MBB4663563.1 putative MATE family efflux protein [Conexibacter arvalis]